MDRLLDISENGLLDAPDKILPGDSCHRVCALFEKYQKNETVMEQLEEKIENAKVDYLEKVREILDKKDISNSTKIELIHSKYYDTDIAIRKLITNR